MPLSTNGSCLPKNWPACRYLTVDAYNNGAARKYYEANGFQSLFSTEKQEREHIGLPDEKELKTRLMFFDLIRLDGNDIFNQSITSV